MNWSKSKLQCPSGNAGGRKKLRNSLHACNVVNIVVESTSEQCHAISKVMKLNLGCLLLAREEFT